MVYLSQGLSSKVIFPGSLPGPIIFDYPGKAITLTAKEVKWDGLDSEED
jgi:hypothetical protein